MKLSEYIKNLQEVKKHFGGDLEVVFAADDEGNSFSPVYYNPTPGLYTEDRQFISEDADENLKINSVCIN